LGRVEAVARYIERTVTLKYIAQNPSEAQAFIDFDTISTPSTGRLF